MSGDVHVRFCESLGLKCPGPLTHNRAKRMKCEKAARKTYAKKATAKKSARRGRR